MTRLLVTGGSSYLGQHLVPAASEQGAVHYTYFQHDPLGLPGGRRLDLRDDGAVRSLIQALQPEVVIHLAGSNSGGESMDEVIRLGAAHIVRATAEIGARLIHMSTDVVFGGDRAPYREEDAPAPLHAYGRAKAAAEELVRSHPNSVIVRTSLIYGLEIIDRGAAWMVEALRAGQPVTLFTDQLRNPIPAHALSRACLELADLDYRGVLHLAGAQCLSRAEFALKMLDWWGVSERAGLRYGSGDPERWPRNCCLDISRAQALLRTPLPGVDEFLQAFSARKNQKT